MNKFKLFFKPIFHSVVTIFIFYLGWLIHPAGYDFVVLLKFIAPYYALWLIILIVSIRYRGKPFRILWMGALRDDDTFSKSNAPYAFSFLLGSILILVLQFFLKKV
jgi:hypothetical protein